MRRLRRFRILVGCPVLRFFPVGIPRQSMLKVLSTNPQLKTRDTRLATESANWARRNNLNGSKNACIGEQSAQVCHWVPRKRTAPFLSSGSTAVALFCYSGKSPDRSERERCPQTKTDQVIFLESQVTSIRTSSATSNRMLADDVSYLGKTG